MSAVHIERLRTLYAVIFGIPARRVNLSSWRDGATRSETSDASMVEHACGSTGCAVGWACAYPPFIKQGLTWEDNAPALDDATGRLDSWDAVNSFFGLSGAQSDYLFMPNRHRHPERLDDRDSAFVCYGHNHKRLVLARIRYHLLHIGAITRDRYLELASQEVRGKLTP
jgi:hypothetical protein